MTTASSNDVTFDIYAKDIQGGDVVTLGTNGQSSYCVNYTVFAVAAPKDILGDVNNDGVFNVADLVMMNKFILGVGDLTKWENGEFIADGVSDVADLVLMRKALIG